jgi:hypothetical protein
MIVSTSRRTDIPAFYSEWFVNRLREGFVLVRNPFNPKQVSRIALSPGVVDFLVFWTKNPEKMLPKLDRINGFTIPYYFLFTLTPYDKSLERNLPSKTKIIDTFVTLSERIGKKRVIWRYDPILLTDRIDALYHLEYFERLCEKLGNHTERCIISFVHMYKKCVRNLSDFTIAAIDDGMKSELLKKFHTIAIKYDITLQTCAVDIDALHPGIKKGKCIDDKLISDITGCELNVKKDKYQRKSCNCVESVDIGSYNTCMNGCLYCYANNDAALAEKNYALHDPQAPLLYGHIAKSDIIVEREMRSMSMVE